jgi:hypothetical protein
VSHGQPQRDPCRCGSARCRGTINFDISDEDANHVEIVDGQRASMDAFLRTKLADYVEYLYSIGQEQVEDTITNMLLRVKLGRRGGFARA